jgi:hypothetical protein
MSSPTTFDDRVHATARVTQSRTLTGLAITSKRNLSLEEDEGAAITNSDEGAATRSSPFFFFYLTISQSIVSLKNSTHARISQGRGNKALP